MEAATRSDQSSAADDPRDGGFSLVELAVVILIIGVLLVVAIPAFLSVRKKAQEKVAQDNIRITYDAARYWFDDSQPQDYTVSGTQVTQIIGPGLVPVRTNAADSANASEVLFWSTTSYFYATARSGTWCFHLHDIGGRLDYWKAKITDGVTCRPVNKPGTGTFPWR